MPHAFCHNKTADRGRGAEHDKDTDQAVIAVSHADGGGKKKRAEQDQLAEGCGERRPKHRERLLHTEAGAHCHQPERRSEIGDVADRFGENDRLRDPAGRPEHSGENSQNDRVACNALDGLFYEQRAAAAFVRACAFEQNDCDYVIERDRADDHHRRDARVSVYILDKADSEKCGAGTKRGLGKFSPGFFFAAQEEEGARDAQKDTDDRHGKTEENKSAVPYFCKVLGGELLEQQHGQRDLENKRVQHAHQILLKNADSAKKQTEQHQKKNRDGCVQAKNQVTHKRLLIRYLAARCGVLRRAAVCCGVLRCVAACCGILRRAAVCCGAVRQIAGRCGVAVSWPLRRAEADCGVCRTGHPRLS